MQLAGLRGVLYNPSKVDLAQVVAPASDGALAASADPHAVALLDAAHLSAWLADGTLARDPTRAVYRYHQVFDGGGRAVTRKMFLAAVKLAPWNDGTVRTHEAVPPVARDVELARLRATGAQLQPLLGGYRDPAGEADRLLRRIESDRPTLEVRTADGVLHRVWREKSAEVLGSLRALLAPKKLHLLEGHARYDALLAYSDELAAPASYAASNYALMALVALDDPALATRARHRVIRGELAKDAVLAAARKYFLVEPLAGAARDPAALSLATASTVMHQPGFALVFAGDPDGYKLTLSPDVNPVSEGVKVHRAIQKLDAIVIEEMFLARALPGAQATFDLDAASALAQLDAGASAVLIQRPMSLEQITHVAELGQTVPAGASAFYPSLAAGLVVHVLDRDEDLV